MVRVLHSIEIKGEKRELLFTPSLYAIAKKKGVVISVEDSGDATQVFTAYTKIIYLAALNAWEVRLFDDPTLGEFPLHLIDFVEWSATEPKTFAQTMAHAVEALTGKPLKSFEKEEVKKK